MIIKTNPKGLRRLPLTKTLAVLTATALFAASVTAGEMVRYKARPLGSKVTIAGTSTIHDWTMDGQLIGGFLEVSAGVVFDQSKTTLPGLTGGKLDARVEATIPVSSMKGQWQGMDEPMQDAMNAKEYPNIQFKLFALTCKEPHVAGTPLEFEAKGELSLHGVTNTISLPVSIESVDKSRLKVVGKIPLKMTDFKVQPPVKLGVFRTGDEVTISFEWLVAQPKTASPQ